MPELIPFAKIDMATIIDPGIRLISTNSHSLLYHHLRRFLLYFPSTPTLSFTPAIPFASSKLLYIR